MKKNTMLLLGVGIGVYYLYSKNAHASPTAYPTPAGFTPPPMLPPTPASGVGSFVGWLSNIFRGGLINPVPLAVGGATDVTDINQVAAQPRPANMTDISGNCVPNGNPCDPADCSYVPGMCDSYGNFS